MAGCILLMVFGIVVILANVAMLILRIVCGFAMWSKRPWIKKTAVWFLDYTRWLV